MKRQSLLLFLPIFMICCGTNEVENPKELLKTRKADAEIKFNQFYACYEIAKETPPVTEDHIDWESQDATGKYGKSNVYQISFPNFKDLSRPLDIPFDGTRRKEHADMAKLFAIDLSDHQEPHEYSDQQKYSWCDPEGKSTVEAIQHFLRSKYLVINRPGISSGPTINGELSFEEGKAKGDVLVFDVIQGKLLGGYQYSAISSDQVKSSSEWNAQSNLDADLSLKIQGKILDTFKELTPSAKGTTGF